MTNDDAYEAFRDNRDTLRHHGNATQAVPEPICAGCGERIPRNAGGMVGNRDLCEPCYSEARAS